MNITNVCFFSLFLLMSVMQAEEAQYLLNASFDPTREFYEKINKSFEAWWKEKKGRIIVVRQSHAGSGSQARAVIQGLQADVVTLALAFDIDMISKGTNWLPADWAKRLPNQSVPFTSTIVFLVRKGNPKNVKDWDDLARDGIVVITPDPKTSGGARWNYLAAYGYALNHFERDEAKAKEYMKKLFKNVPVLETGARSATTTFAERGIGDVLVTWENEAHLVLKEFGKDKFDILMPSLSINAKMPVAWIDKVVNHKGTRTVAKEYLRYLYTENAQEIAAESDFRPSDEKVQARYAERFPSIPMLDIDKDFGGWENVQKKHFADGALFDQIYQP